MSSRPEQAAPTFVLTGAEIAERKRFLELTPEDEAVLATLHGRLAEEGVVGEFVDRFYSHLRSFPGPARMLEDETRFARLRRSQAVYFDRLTAGDYDAAYVADRLRVGEAHQRVGLEPQWYFGAYNKYLALLMPRVADIVDGDPVRFRQAMLAILKVVWFDMGLAVDTYIGAGERAIRRHQAKLEALDEIAVTLTSSLSLREILDLILQRGISLGGATAACIALRDGQTGEFTERHTHGLSPDFVRQMVFRPGDPAHEVCDTVDEVHVLSNDRVGTRHALSRLARDEGIRSFLCLPLRHRGQRLGAVYFYRSDRDDFDAAEIGLLKTFARLASGAIANARAHEQVEWEAGTDALTGLANRRLFDRRLDQEMRRMARYGTPVTLAIVDIDRFKAVNDRLGHPTGDAVLRQMGARLVSQFRDVDFVARYGGEEFAVILVEADGETGLKVVDRMRAAIGATPFELPDGGELAVTVSVGVAGAPRCGATAAEIISRADQALYAAKQGGRNRVELSTHVHGHPVDTRK